MGSTEILISGGVAALLAAIVGGGLKAFGIELPLLASMQRQALLLVVGVALIGLGLYADRPQADGAGRPDESDPIAESAPESPVASPPETDSAPRLATAGATQRPDVPNIVGLPFAAARQFLVQNSWAPINSSSSPMANENLGLRAREVFDTGYLEMVSCSGASMAPCLFRYRHPAGHILEVVTIGEDLTQAIVNRALILDCAAEPKPDGCEG
jgi:hypothetical protein